MPKKKRGSQYEEAVAEVIRIMDPGATVTQGEWAPGPGGLRELDIHVSGSYQGQLQKVLIECKDFSPTSHLEAVRCAHNWNTQIIANHLLLRR